jgi:hypothetical protein
MDPFHNFNFIKINVKVYIVLCVITSQMSKRSGTLLHNKQMVIQYYQFVFVYICGYHCYADSPTCDFIQEILSFSTFQSTVSLMVMITLY